jgi:NET1-associated nuclear protein 1 (U3 small nucleolar RNA-associated protein 17)
VLWQLDTGKTQFLPHMSATIQNIVVSPLGSSYAIHLADNSTMVLSTSELQPTANIAGIQAPIIGLTDPLDSQVVRLEADVHKALLVQRTPAVINPINPSRMLLGVGELQEVGPQCPTIMGVPFLQTFDISTCHNVSRQALTRSNITNINVAPSSHRISEPRVTHLQISHDGTWLATVDQWIPPKRDLEFIGYQGMDIEAERQIRREVFLKFWQWKNDNSTWELVSRVDAPHTSNQNPGSAGKVLDLAADPSSLCFSTIGEDGVIRTWSPKSRKRDRVVVRGKDGGALRSWSCQHAISIGKSGTTEYLANSSFASGVPTNGCVAFSEDGSILAAAIGGKDDGLTHFLDPASVAIRLSRTGMFKGEIVKMDILGQCLISLSDNLFVYDLVLDELRYSIKLGSPVRSLSTEQKLEMMHLATNQKSGTFAVAFPCKNEGRASVGLKTTSLLDHYSELAFFTPEKPRPILKDTLPTLVTALMPAISSDGYVILDTAAEIRTVSQKGSQIATALAKSTSELQLDTEMTEQPAVGLLQLVEDVETTEESKMEPAPPTASTDTDDDNDGPPIVTQQQLSEIFDIGPAFALPPIEDMFYQVARLFSSKPVAQGVS